MGFYFDRIYNPVYDFIVGQVAPYRRLQETCVRRLELAEGDRVLCAGIGTGNEVLRILDHNRSVHVTGVDYSSTALKKAERKARKLGVAIETRLMDVQKLDFPDGSFDKVLCIHVMDFVPDSTKAAAELVRVLKKGGRFVITFPSAKEDLAFMASLVAESIREDIRKKRYYLIPAVIGAMLFGAIVYAPFLLRRAERKYSPSNLKSLLSSSRAGSYRFDRFVEYSDLVVEGEK